MALKSIKNVFNDKNFNKIDEESLTYFVVMVTRVFTYQYNFRVENSYSLDIGSTNKYASEVTKVHGKYASYSSAKKSRDELVQEISEIKKKYYEGEKLDSSHIELLCTTRVTVRRVTDVVRRDIDDLNDDDLGEPILPRYNGLYVIDYTTINDEGNKS